MVSPPLPWGERKNVSGCILLAHMFRAPQRLNNSVIDLHIDHYLRSSKSANSSFLFGPFRFEKPYICHRSSEEQMVHTGLPAHRTTLCCHSLAFHSCPKAIKPINIRKSLPRHQVKNVGEGKYMNILIITVYTKEIVARRKFGDRPLTSRLIVCTIDLSSKEQLA